MKKNDLFIPAILTTGILLASCGTADLAEEEPEVVEPAETNEKENSDTTQKTETPEVHVTGIAFESDNIVARVTIFDQSTAEARNGFIQMAQTIERVQK
ncbi:hypothetical protein PO902_14345 [Planococcus maritimus]|nr:hypothetical protein [Planococcus sp. SK3692]MDE4086223.1 hypothetical protein [Planococcus maritimus]